MLGLCSLLEASDLRQNQVSGSGAHVQFGNLNIISSLSLAGLVVMTFMAASFSKVEGSTVASVMMSEIVKALEAVQTCVQ